MLNYYSFVNDFIRIGEKLIFQKINKKLLTNNLNIKQLEITFRIPSESKFEHGFIALLMLTEKMLNNKPIFLLDKNTLSKKRSIKVGLIVTIKNEMIDFYLNLCNIHSIPRFYDYGISFSISNADQPFIYKMKKILSNTVFNFDKDVYSYYDYLGDLEYEFEFLFRTYFKNILMNKLIISNKGIYFSNFTELIKLETIEEIQKQIELEEMEELEELKKLGKTIEDFDNFDNFDTFDTLDNLNDKFEDENNNIDIFDSTNDLYYYSINDINENNFNEFNNVNNLSDININNQLDFNININVNNNNEKIFIKYLINKENEKYELSEDLDLNKLIKYENKIYNCKIDNNFIDDFTYTFKNKYVNLFIKNKEKILYKGEIFDNKIITNNIN
jgi:hypothetical protein